MAVSPLPPSSADPAALVASGRRVFEIERDALAAVAERLGDGFSQACQLVQAAASAVSTATTPSKARSQRGLWF